MEVLVYLVPLALLLGLLGLAGFMWTLDTGQYDDLDGAAWRAISDDDVKEPDRRPAPQTKIGGDSVLAGGTAAQLGQPKPVKLS